MYLFLTTWLLSGILSLILFLYAFDNDVKPIIVTRGEAVPFILLAFLGYFTLVLSVYAFLSSPNRVYIKLYRLRGRL